MKEAARVASEVNYNSIYGQLCQKFKKIKIRHYKAYYAKNKKAFVLKQGTNIRCVNKTLIRQRPFFQEMEANLLNNSKARLALKKVLKEQNKTLAEQARGVLCKTAC